ncbi:hypothetical protein KXD40_008903 [Peronospora effusa]|nr:hypothetical protein KXD40_008903 [Peronospora effusa]
MPIDVIVKVPSPPVSDTPLDTTTLVLLHHKGHFCLLDRNLRDFLHLERQLLREFPAKVLIPDAISISSLLEAYDDAKTSFYPSHQLVTRLEIVIETFLHYLTSNSELLTTSLALKTFLYGNLLTCHKTMGQSYRDAVEAAIEAKEKYIELLDQRVAAGCSVKHQVTVTMEEEKQLVLWKFTSQDTGLIFRALFSSGDRRKSTEIDPYSVSSNEVVENETDEIEVAYYKTHCTFDTDEGYVYGHYVAEKNGVVTLLWENVDMNSVMSKSLRFQVKVVSLSAAGKVLEVTDALKNVDMAEWLHEYVDASEIMSIKDLVGWETYECEDAFDKDEAYDDGLAKGDSEVESQIQVAVLEERNYELEMQVTCLEESLTAAKKELKSALDRVQIAEEIHKANLETITQIECANASSTTQKVSRVATAPLAGFQSGTLHPDGTQTEETPSSELERVQKLCAGFQEQCLWRSVENMELETQLAVSQSEASSWREKHVKQAAQLKELEKQNCTLRTHKKMLVQEVKRLQPYSQVNLAALVQEAQEARMVQRSLQAKLDLHELVKNAMEVSAIESEPADFVLVEASEDEEV